MPAKPFSFRPVLWFFGLLMAGCSFFHVAEVRAEALVEQVTFTPRSDGGGYVIRVVASERVAAYWAPRETEPGRVEWVLINAGLAPGYRQVMPVGPVRAFSAVPGRGHLVLRFQMQEGVNVVLDAYRDRRSNDLLLSLAVEGGAPAYAEDSPVALPRPVASAHSFPVRTASHAEQAPATPPGGAERWRLDTVVIDAGHGGHDVGAAANGIREKDVTLAVARRLGHLLETQLGLNVIYTRDDDRFITLKNRGKIANEAGGKLFISIHANAAGNRKAHGTETYFLGMHKNAAAQTVMQRENSVVRLENDPDQYEHLDEQALILRTLANSAYMRQAEQLAAAVEGEFKGELKRTSRGVKQAGFYVLWGASMPAVLVELGFVTNPTEAKFLNSEAGQTHLARALYKAVFQFKEQYEKGLHLSAR